MQTATSGALKKTSGSTWTIYGQSGSGKTPLATCFPHPWVWDCESGARSMLLDDIPVTRVETYSDAMILEQAAREHAGTGWINIPGGGGKHKFCTLVVDTLGEFTRILEGAAKGTKEQATLPEWYLTVERTRKITRALRNLAPHGLNVVFITHEQYMKQAEVEVIVGAPDLPGKELPIDLPKLTDVVAHLQAKQGQNGLERELIAEPHGVFVGRDRRNLLTRIKVDFKDVKALQALITAKGGAIHSCGQEA